jgi:hypothetical protein
MKKVNSKYPCKQAEFYEVCALILVSLREMLSFFTAFKPKYVSAFVDALEAKLNEAMALPDYDQRRGTQIIRRELVIELVKPMQVLLLSLKSYIRSAYANEAIRKAKETQAGFEKYESAMKYNWEALKDLLLKCKSFLADNEADLLANDNMPVGFKANFDAKADEIIAAIPDMLNTRENNEENTQIKIMANNALYDKIMDICEDGNVVFHNDKQRYDQFVFAQVLQIVTPPGAASMRGVIKDMVTSVGLDGAMVIIKSEDVPEVTAVADSNGKYKFGNLPVGKYKGVVRKDGYQAYDFEVMIKTGETNFENFWLIKEVES